VAAAKLATEPVGSTWLLSQRKMRATSVYESVRATIAFTSFRKVLPPETAAATTRFDWKGRRGQESNLPRLLRTDNGFEDREVHQAPFTLRIRENAERSTANAQRLKSEKERSARLSDFLNCGDNLVEVGPVAGIEFGMEQFAIGADFKSAAARGNERKRFDAFAEFKNFGRQ